MYNEKLKADFIKHYTTSTLTSQRCVTVFNEVEPFENEWGADFCTKSADELRPVITKISGLRSRSSSLIISLLKEYVKWCVENGVDGANDGMLLITDVGLDKIKTQTISDPGHLQRYLDVICRPVEKQTTDDTIRCYFWLAYAGMKEEDILNVSIYDVDFDNMVVHYSKEDTDVVLYQEALPVFHNCVELKQFFYENTRYEMWRDRLPGDNLLRGIRSEFSIKSIRVVLSKAAKREESTTSGMKLSYNRVRLSGVFYRAYQDEMAGLPVDFRQYVDFIRKGKEYDLKSCRNTQDSKLRQLVREYEEDYRRWKAAWYQ